MALFDYESSGPGISKNAPKKKGIALFFDILLRKIWKLFELNFLYFLFFIPLFLSVMVIFRLPVTGITPYISLLLILLFAVLIGPATAGMTKVIRYFLIEKHSYIVRDFFNGFRTNFKNAAIVGVVDCLIILSAYASVIVYPRLASAYHSFLLYVPLAFVYSIVILAVLMNFYIFLMMTATNLSLKNLLKNSAVLAFIALKKNIITFLITAAITAGMVLMMLYMLPLFLTIIPFFPAAFVCFIICFNSYPIIQKYVINPYYESIGKVNPELTGFDDETGAEPIFEDMGGKEAPIEKRRKGKGKRIS